MASVVSNHQPATAPGFVPMANVAQQPYVSELLSFTLDRLHKEPELIRVDSERLRRQMQEVVVGNYRAFITASDALQSVKEEVSSIDKHLESLDMFMRMTFDSICEVGFGVEIGSLASSLPDVPFASAFDRSNALCASRYFDPLWKLKKRFNLGSEVKLKQDVRVLDDFTYAIIHKGRNLLNAHQPEVKSDLLSRFLFMAKENPETYTDKKLRDAILNFIIAGRDTTAVTLSWLFWLLSMNPSAEDKIVQELEEVERSHGGLGKDHNLEKYSQLLTYDTLSKMHYLHAAITESLRLYPAVPLDGKTAVSDDILPDGTKVTKGNVINYVPYAMGRMQRLWGDDALDFKPERWLNNDGVFQPQSPFKFTAFQAGPRICLGKDSAYLQMKMAAATLLRFFKFELVAGYRIEYMVALTLLMSSSQGLPMAVHPRH